MLHAGVSEEREKAKIGLFLTLADSTTPMRTEAVKAGWYEAPCGRFPKLQVLTIRELFEGRQPKIPFPDPSAFAAAPRESRQERLF